MRPQAGSLGHKKFDSLASFQAAFAGGITVDCPVRNVIVDASSGKAARKIRMRSLENMTATYNPSAVKDGVFRCGIPAGDYQVQGELADDTEGVALLHVEAFEDAHVTWSDYLPGFNELRVQMRRPMAGQSGSAPRMQNRER